MDLEITFHKIDNEDNVSFNVNCVTMEDHEELAANDEMPIDELFEMDISESMIRSIPDTIGRLTELRLLCLVDNELESLPDSIGNLVNLERLYLDGNQLVTLPAIGRLTNLSELNLSNNRLTSFSDFGRLSRLSILDLHGNRLTTFPAIRRLVNLKILNLSDNRLTSLPRTIENLTNLQDLDLSINNIQSIPASIGHLNLVELDLSNNPITRIPTTFEHLRLRRCILPDNILLEPMRKEYRFTNRVVLNEVRRVFDIRAYNDIMEAEVERQNVVDRKATKTYAKASTKYYASRSKTAKNPPSSNVFAKKEFINHITKMLGNTYVPRSTNDVIR